MQNGILYYDMGDGIRAFTTMRGVGRNAGMLCCLLGTDESRFIRPHQTHQTEVALIDEPLMALSADEKTEAMEGVDAVVCSAPGIVTGVSTADCIPVLVYDPVHHAAAAIHAGWRGTVARIVTASMKRMAEEFDTRPEDCSAVIGPGISLASFEVGDEVYGAFDEAGFPMEKIARRYPVMNGKGGEDGMKWHLDIKESNRLLLAETGIPEAAIMVSSIDTYTDERFFSARREQRGTVKCGRIFSGFVLG